jgi:hypothetical protein
MQHRSVRCNRYGCEEQSLDSAGWY